MHTTWSGVGFVNSRLIALTKTNRAGDTYSSGFTAEALAYEVLDASTTNVIYVGDLLRAYREGGASQVLRAVENAVASILRSVYGAIGLEFDGEIGFSRLADLGLIDESTAAYLIATYMSIEQAVEEAEELEELGEKQEVERVLREADSKLQEIIRILGNLETSSPRFGSNRSYYTTYYIFTGVTYMVSVRVYHNE